MSFLLVSSISEIAVGAQDARECFGGKKILGFVHSKMRCK